MIAVRNSRILRLILFILILAVLCPFAQGKVIYVDDDATGANVGSSWMYAVNSLQDALLLANFYDKPVEIRVAQGIYTPDNGIGIRPGDREASFELINKVTIKGGYAGLGNPDPNARNIELYETILSGNLGNDDRKNDNSYHVVTGNGTDNSAILDGFVVTGGRDYRYERDSESIPLYPIGHGAGIYNSAGSPTVNDCTFVDNHANAGGGGMYNNDNSNPTLTNCIFIANNESGMFNMDSSPTLNNCIFKGNKSGGGGGGMKNHSSNPNLTNCIFNENVGGFEGGGIYNTRSNLTLTNCIFNANIAVCGGGIANLDYSQSTLLNCTFSTNLADDSGGGIYNVRLGKLTIVNCIFSNNKRFEIVNANGNTSIAYSNIQGGQSSISDPWFDFIWGKGNIDENPLFAKPGYWANVNDPNIILEPYDPNAVWVDGDYHLKSQYGRYDPNSESWVIDDVTSPCIDAGDPNTPVAFEPFPNGGRINMGAYGGTVETSKSPSGLHVKYGGGTGEPNDPYLIYTAEQMNAIGTESNDWDKHFKLMADIDLSEYTGSEFNIIGSTYNNAFAGTFNGQGHSIRNFTFKDPSRSIIGLFGCISKTSEITNIDLVDANVDGENYVGLLVGYSNGGTVLNCSSTGNIQAEQYTGGLIGINMNSAKTLFCNAIANVSGTSTTGGLVGANSHSDISYCVASGVTSGTSTTGGITGRQDYGTVSNSFSDCVVSGKSNMIGGLVGRNNYSFISCCCSSGEVSGDTMVGGLVGFSDSDIINSYSNAKVTGVDNVGGLLGYNIYGNISYSYSANEVIGSINVGALLGYDEGTCHYTSCFWDADIQPSLPGISNATEPGLIGVTTQQMRKHETFTAAGWDFVDETANGTEDIWWMPENDYPRLWWELISEN